jgi:iron complex transport system ATP-binding protein
MNEIYSENLSVGYDQTVVIDQLSMRVPSGKLIAIVGANGSGKSTLLKTFSRILKPFDGNVYLDSHDIHAVSTRELARRISILPQRAQAPEALTVYELVSYGRYPHQRWLVGSTAEDARMIRWALETVSLGDLADRPVLSLSGGQQQRVWIAMTLAQGASCMLLDEPTSHLDTCHQLEIMELLSRLNREENKTIIMVLHDLNLAARYAHHIIALEAGRIAAEGPPIQVLTPEILRQVFRIEARVFTDSQTGALICVPLSPVADSEHVAATSSGASVA